LVHGQIWFHHLLQLLLLYGLDLPQFFNFALDAFLVLTVKRLALHSLNFEFFLFFIKIPLSFASDSGFYLCLLLPKFCHRLLLMGLSLLDTFDILYFLLISFFNKWLKERNDPFHFVVVS
jgi:hypothetical protein